MASIMNNLHQSENSVPAQIQSLCDLVPDKKRTEKDFQDLLNCLTQYPKECTPFRARILQHLQAHAYGNGDANVPLLSSCFARAILLFRNTPNKSEGSLGAWKAGLLKEIVTFEKGLDELYKIVGITSNTIVKVGTSDEDEDLESKEKLTEENADYINIINDHVIRINFAAHNIRALITVSTGYHLPIPVVVLLKLATKAGLLRWKDYKKRPNGPLRNHVYSLSPYLININLMLFRSIITIAESSIIPFISFINQDVLRALEWTRTSNLLKHDENLFHLLRANLLKMITFIVKELSLNINLEPKQLNLLLETELVGNLEELVGNHSSKSTLKDEHVVEALNCLDELMLVYQKFLEQPLELKVKNYVIQTCLKIYRDFETSVISAPCRRGLLRLLQTIANQPYATSTTNIAYHIFELVQRRDGEMRSVARRWLDIGLAHRPTIVSHYDVYDCYSRPMLVARANASESDSVEKMISEPIEQQQQQVEQEDKPTEEDKPVEKNPEVVEDTPVADMSVEKEIENSVNEGEKENGTLMLENNLDSEVRLQVEETAQTHGEVVETPAAAPMVENNGFEKAAKEPEKQPLEANKDQVRDESEVQTYMSYFVERLA